MYRLSGYHLNQMLRLSGQQNVRFRSDIFIGCIVQYVGKPVGIGYQGSDVLGRAWHGIH